MIDRVEIVLKGGDGGRGCVSFRREKFVPRGGPNGGDGGDGGDVILIAKNSVRTLQEIGRRRIYRGERGQHGMGSDRHGRRGQALTMMVPVGTVVTILHEDGREERLADLVQDGMSVVAARGGKGGWGNARFATSTNRAPRIAQNGQAGEELRVRLDLKLLADIGIAGLPNAGKSTLLSGISAARPKVADYPFTTLEPALGVVDFGWERFVVADIPGLIEGAHEGAGLGLDFLRHIERTKIILHLVDGSSPDPRQDLLTVEEELRQYGHGMEDRPRVLAVNKIDIPDVAEREDELREVFRERDSDPLFISAAAGTGLDALIQRLGGMLSEMVPVAKEEGEAETIVRPEEKTVVSVRRENGAFRVEGRKVVAFAEMMPLDQDEAQDEVWRRFLRWGVISALRRAGAKPGDTILIGEVELEWQG